MNHTPHHYQSDVRWMKGSIRKFLRCVFKVAFYIFVAVGLFALVTLAANAQGMPCNERSKVLEHLEKKFKEAPIAVGVTNQGALIEIIATKDRSTWTIIISMPDGTSCLVTAGEGWRELPWIPLGEKAT